MPAKQRSTVETSIRNDTVVGSDRYWHGRKQTRLDGIHWREWGQLQRRPNVSASKVAPCCPKAANEQVSLPSKRQKSQLFGKVDRCYAKMPVPTFTIMKINKTNVNFLVYCQKIFFYFCAVRQYFPMMNGPTLLLFCNKLHFFLSRREAGRIQAKKIDSWSRWMFPVSYFSFQAAYWYYYLRLAA